MNRLHLSPFLGIEKLFKFGFEFEEIFSVGSPPAFFQPSRYSL
jgi:hypothetical protein